MNPVGIVIAAAAMLASGAASADPPECAPIAAQYVALLRQAGSTNQNALAQQLAAARADAESGNCNRFLFFGPPKSPACPSIQATIERLEDQLGGGRGSGWSSGPSLADQQAFLRADLQENNCSIPSLQASGPGRTLCVRTCDGYYFPIESRASSSRVKVDAAVCQTMYGKAGLATLFVQRGDDVADARSIDGKRYGDQPFAFQYRDNYDAACHAELKAGMATLEARAIAAGPPTPVADASAAPGSEALGGAPLADAGDASPVPDAAAAAVSETVPNASTKVAAQTASAATASAPVAGGKAALQAITAVQPVEEKRPVRFVGSAYYAKMFSYSGPLYGLPSEAVSTRGQPTLTRARQRE